MTAAQSSLFSPRPQKMPRWVIFSLVGHLVIVGAFAVLSSFRSAPRISLDQKPISASLVRLGKPRDQKLLPRKEELPPPPKEVKGPPPVPEAPPPAAPKPEAVAIPGLAPKPAPPTAGQAGQKDGEDRRKALFSAFNKTGKKAEEEPEGAEDGDPLGTSAKAEGERYFGMLHGQIQRYYNVAQTISEQERMHLSAQVLLRVGRAGELLEVDLAKSSSNDLFDSAVLGAVKRAAPFSPPPEHLRAQLASGVQLRFTP